MSENKEDRVLFKNKVKIKDKVKIKNKVKNKVKNKFRDTVLVRMSRDVKEDMQKDAMNRHETLSQIIDWAAKEYLKSVKPLD